MTMTKLGLPDLLTARQCAKHANMSVPAIKKLIRSGELPVRVSGIAVRVRLKDLQWFEDARPSGVRDGETNRSSQNINSVMGTFVAAR
jgi:hypothetical protein